MVQHCRCVLNATGFFSLKWLVLYYGNFKFQQITQKSHTKNVYSIILVINESFIVKMCKCVGMEISIEMNL